MMMYVFTLFMSFLGAYSYHATEEEAKSGSPTNSFSGLCQIRHEEDEGGGRGELPHALLIDPGGIKQRFPKPTYSTVYRKCIS